MMPTPVLFTVFSFLLRVMEGTGTAMYTTVSYTLLAQFYREKKGTTVVSDFIVGNIRNQHFVTYSEGSLTQGCKIYNG